MAQVLLSKPAGTIAEFGDENLIVLGDVEPHLGTTLRLIRNLDSAPATSHLREFVVKNLDSARLATLAKQFADRQRSLGIQELRGEVVASGSSRVLIVAPPSVHPEWEALLTQLDQIEPIERRIYSVSAFGLKEVASLIEQSVRQSGRSGGGSGLGDDGRWKLVADDLTGSLIISASRTEHDQIVELLERLNSVPPEARRPVRSFKIKNRGVKEMRSALLELLNAGVFEAAMSGSSPALGSGSRGESSNAVANSGPSGTASAQSNVRSFSPGGTVVPTLPSGSAADSASERGDPLDARANAGQPPDGRPGQSDSLVGTTSAGGWRQTEVLTLTADEPTNTLIAVGDPRILSQIESLLPTLDVRQAQVMFDAYLVGLTDSQSLDFGVELERLRVSGDLSFRLSSLFGLAGGAAGNRTVPDRAGFSGSILSPGEFSVVMRALQGINKGRSLSNPRILVSNNEQATFNSVLQQPFASTNASTTVATTAFGGTQDAGTTISVKPQVAQGDHIVLNYSVSLSSFVGSAANANLPPPRQQNSVQSSVTIPDDYTVVVGGLESVSEGDSQTQVPIVGSVPIVGELFKNRTVSKSRTRFFVFLRATVLRSTNLDDLKYISDPALGQAGIESGLPPVEPRVIP